MRKALIALAVAMLVAAPAMAELQNVIVGGQVKIRANYYMSAFGSGPAAAAYPGIQPEIRWPGFFVPGRAIGGPFGNNVVSFWRWNDEGNDLDFVESWTRLNVKADFTDQVSAFIEFDSFDIWGEDFRSDYITGTDFAAASGDDVEVYQAYIEANEMWGTPLRVRVGRQELSFGSEWLVGTNDTNSYESGLSFDALRLTYGTDLFSVDAWAAKLNERFAAEEDGDVDFYGVYGSYTGLEEISIDAYWLMVRDAISLNDTNFVWFPEWIEDWLGVDDYDPTYLHTFGLRGAGTIGAFDFELEGAYQMGDADSAGFTFAPFLYGDDGAEYDGNWAVNGEVGYTFDMNYQPRVFLGGAWFTGEDERDLTFWEWLNPFNRPEASISFNRLFSNWEYSQFLDIFGDMSNFWTARLGFKAAPTESVDVLLKGSYFQVDESFDAPRHVRIGRYRVPVAPNLSFWTEENDDSVGIEAELSAVYRYSEDLSVEAGWAHLFLDDGLEDGNFTARNGLVFNGGSSDDDADYVWVETRLTF
jgi:hypothetical protein